MNVEHIRLSNSEIAYCKRNLLVSLIELLRILKRYKEYKILRNEEFILKVALKSKIDEAKNSFDLIDKLLPKTNLKKDQIQRTIFSKKKNISLEQEIDQIRKKLEKIG